jgi:8-oxo-dGTP diphosphatase
VVYTGYMVNTNLYKNPIPTVDAIIQRESEILLIRRKKDPFKEMWALPGGFVNENEKVEDAVLREVREETTLEIRLIDILGVYSDPKRDPRKHIMTIVFIGEVEENNNIKAVAADDASATAWLNLESIDEHSFAFDHSKIINDFKKWRVCHSTFWSSKD